MGEYRLTPAAENDLEKIWLYTSRHWGIDYADRYIDSLINAYGELAHAPKIAQASDYIRSGYRRYLVKRHLIYFRITSYGSSVVRILHERMETFRHL